MKKSQIITAGVLAASLATAAIAAADNTKPASPATVPTPSEAKQGAAAVPSGAPIKYVMQ